MKIQFCSNRCKKDFQDTIDTNKRWGEGTSCEMHWATTQNVKGLCGCCGDEKFNKNIK